MSLPARSWLYVPATSPELLDKAMRGAADAVVYDLEDSVAASAKNTAREVVLTAAATPHPKPLWARINHPAGLVGRADVRALSKAPLAGVRIPKAEDPDLVASVAEQLGLALHLLLESAVGVQRAPELARCHPSVVAISLGEADLAADLRVRDTTALEWARQRVLVAARAAGLPNPVHSVWTGLHDRDGLAEDSRRARDRGFFGRSVIHPSQIDVVNHVFTPDQDEVDSARSLVDSLHANEAEQRGGWVDDHGRFVDEAVVSRARWILELADALPVFDDQKGRTE